ncbi:hypothetical protein RUM44_006634 [Polyplax serrata]|uniref:Uncharacterized protein n=1 Tax=Polyplax serrata TaxID=468196 RepID=A0ABR1AIN1_POLSC
MAARKEKLRAFDPPPYRKQQSSGSAVEYNIQEEDSTNEVHVAVPRLRSSEQTPQEMEGVALQSLSQCPSDPAAVKNVPSAMSSRRNSNSQGQSLTPSVIVNVPTTRATGSETPEGCPPTSQPQQQQQQQVGTQPPVSTASSTTDSRPHIRISSL